MPVETVNYIADLNPDWPDGSEPKSQGDDHLRGIKKGVRQSFPNVAGPVSANHIELNRVSGVTGNIQNQLNARALKSGDAYTGAHNFGGASSVSLPSSTNIGAITPSELGALLGVTSGIQAQIDGKVSKSGDSYTGNHNMIGASVSVADRPLSDSSVRPANTKFVKDAIADAVLSAALPGQAGNAGKFITTNGVSASWATVVVNWTGQVTGTPTTAQGYGITNVPIADVTRIYGKADRMADAPLFTWVAYDTVTGRGSDWPPAAATPAQFGYWLVFTYGSTFNGVIRLHQTAIQVYTQGGQGQKFERVKQDATWSAWDRVLTGNYVVEADNGGSISGSTYLLDPRVASVHQKALAANTTIQLPEPFSGGDQVTLMLYQTGNFSVAFSSNVALPIGRAMPTIGSGEMLPISFVPKYSGANKWYALIGERYSQ